MGKDLKAGWAQKTHVVVLPNVRRGRDIVLDLVERADARIVQVQNGARRLNKLALFLAACGETRLEELFVLVYEVVQLPVGVGERGNLAHVELAQLLDVDRSAVLIRPVIVLGVIHVDLGAFGVIKSVTRQVSGCSRFARQHEAAVRDDDQDSRGNLVRPELFSPLFIVRPHQLGLGQVELSCAKETKQRLVVVSIQTVRYYAHVATAETDRS